MGVHCMGRMHGCVRQQHAAAAAITTPCGDVYLVQPFSWSLPFIGLAATAADNPCRQSSLMYRDSPCTGQSLRNISAAGQASVDWKLHHCYYLVGSLSWCSVLCCGLLQTSGQGQVAAGSPVVPDAWAGQFQCMLAVAICHMSGQPLTCSVAPSPRHAINKWAWVNQPCASSRMLVMDPCMETGAASIHC